MMMIIGLVKYRVKRVDKCYIVRYDDKVSLDYQGVPTIQYRGRPLTQSYTPRCIGREVLSKTQEVFTMNVGRSKTGLPTITESGGGMTNTGYCTVVCGKNGEALKPLFVPRGYSNGDHAIFVAQPGMCLVNASRDRGGETVTVERIKAIGTNDDPDELITEVIYEYENGDGNIPAKFQPPVDAALGKAYCYHCREPHFIKDGV